MRDAAQPEADLVDRWCARFVAQAALPDGEPVPALLAPELIRLVALAQTTHPSLPFDADSFIDQLASFATPADLTGYLARCRAGDLWLAVQAAAGVPAAVAVFDRQAAPIVGAVCRRFASAAESDDDLRQVVMARLLVSEPDRPAKLCGYAGQGFLENWLRVTAMRECLDRGKRKDRARERQASDSQLDGLPDALASHLDLVKREHRAVVAAAMQAAAQALSAEDRHVLRQHYVAGMSIDQLGVALGLHRATAARRIAKARETLTAATHAALRARLGQDDAEVRQVLAQAMSRLEVSVGALLASVAPGQGDRG